MDGVDEFDAAEIELIAAAMVQRMHARRALLVEPGGDFKVGNHQRVGAFGDFHRVADVVVVAVRNEDEIRRDRFHVNGFGQRIAGDERVEQAGSCRQRLHRETGVTVVSDFHRIDDTRFTRSVQVHARNRQIVNRK